MGKTIDCTYPGCDIYSTSAVSMCDAHKWRRLHGKDMDAPIRRLLPRATSLRDRLYARLDVSGGVDACWEWTGHRRKRSPRGLGYARMGIGGNRTDYVHRVSYIVHFNPIPDGMQVCHRCDNPPCGNPSHLFLGTLQDNQADKVTKGRQLRGERHPRHKLAAVDVVEIRSLHAHGWDSRDLASRFGVSVTTVYNIVAYRSWTSYA